MFMTADLPQLLYFMEINGTCTVQTDLQIITNFNSIRTIFKKFSHIFKQIENLLGINYTY